MRVLFFFPTIWQAVSESGIFKYITNITRAARSRMFESLERLTALGSHKHPCKAHHSPLTSRAKP